MYSKEDEKQLLALTKKLLASIDAGKIGVGDISGQIDELRQVINYHDWRYYIQSANVISDFEYDTIFKQLKKLEENNPLLVTLDSPTQRVARGLTETFHSVQHSVPMLSLDNSYNEEDLLEFDRRVRDLSEQEDILYVVEPKFDGSSIALLYENDKLIRAATRGDGIVGEEITNNAKVIRSIPLSANFSDQGIYKIELRGEVVISNNFFKQMNARREEDGLAVFQNTRNTAAGGLRMKDPNEVSKRGLEAFIYQIGYAVDKAGNNLFGNKLNYHDKNIALLAQLGFKTPTIEKGNIKNVLAFREVWEEKRDSYPYEIDGMVIKVDDLNLQDRIGSTAHHPRWAIAFKFKAKQAKSKLKNIEYQVGRTGAVTPVAKISPVRLAGVTISSISLHNADFIAEKDIRIDDTVIVERAGDVIPYIVGVVKEERPKNSKPIFFPTKCPECDSVLYKPEEEAVWRCINAECPAQAEERLIHFVSKGAMDIDGLGKDIIKRFYNEGLINNIHDIYQLDYTQILALEGWKEKSVENLKQGVEQSTQNPLWKLIVALGIRHVGSATAKILAKEVDSILDLQHLTIEQLTELEDVGPKVAQSIYDFFKNEQNIELLTQLAELGVKIEKGEDEKPLSNLLEGQSFLFTGTLNQFSRNDAKEMVEKNGGKTVSSVSSKLNYLIVGSSPGSKLTKAEKIGTINILSETEFLNLIQ